MASKNIQIKGSFDASQILASFRKIRDEAAKSNVSDKLLGGYDKELEKVEKLITLIAAAQSRGLTDNLSIKEFSRLVGLLEKLFGILNVKAQGFTDAANYKTESANLRKYTSQLEALIKKQDGLRKAAEDYIDTNKKSLGINEKEAKLLKKAMADAEAYKKVVDDLVISKAKAAQQLATTESVKTKVGKEIVDNATGGNFEFGIAAKKGRDKSRENLAAKGLIDELKALTAALKEYQLTLRKTMEEGGTAEDAIKSFIEVMLKYKLEVKNADEVLQQFQLDMDKIVDTAMNTTDTKGGLDRNIKRLVSTNQNLSLAAANLINALPILEANDNLNELAAVKGKIALENDKLHKLNELAATDLLKLNEDARKTSQGIINGLDALGKEALKYVDVLNLIKNGFESIGRGAKLILSVTTAWRSLRNVVKSTFNDIKELDKAFGSIAMVTSYSVKDMWAQYDQYAAMANKLGQSTKSVVEASALYYQQGLKTNEVMLLTEETMKLATLAGLDFKEATSQMTAALRAFHMDMSEGAHVTDVYAEVAAHAAVDVQGLSEAMSATAAIANSAGMSFENTTAMLATMVEATQEAPKNLGTAMKTILARFTELKTNVAGTADSEFDDLDYNKVDKALKSVGVSIKDATGLFRNMDEVLLELSSKWKGLDRNSLRYIATIAAGSRQQSRFIALMENYERTMELVNVALDSAGRSSQQFAKYLDTVEYRLNKISNTWEQFKTNLLTSDFYKDVLDNFNGFLNKLNNTSVVGLTTLAGTWMTFGRRAISGTIDTFSSGVGSIFTGNKAKQKFFEENKNKDGYSMFHVGTGELIPDNEALEEGWEKQKAKNVIKGLAIGTAIAASITAGVTATMTSDSGWEAAWKSFGMSAVSNVTAGFQAGGLEGALVGLALSAATAAISGIVTYFKKLAEEREAKTIEKRLESAKKQLEEIGKQTEELKNQLKGNNKEIKDLKLIQEQYDKLADKLYLTNQELEEFNKLVETLLNDYPELIETYDEENKKLKISTDLLKQKLDTTEKLQKETQLTLILQTAEKAIVENEQDILLNKTSFKKAFIDKFKDLNLTKKDPNSGIVMVLLQGELAEAIYSAYLKNNYDVDKTIEALREEEPEGFSGDTKELLNTVKEFLNIYKSSNKKDFKETAKISIEDSDNELIKLVNENTKNSLAIALNEIYDKRYELAAKNKDFLLMETEGYTKLNEEELLAAMQKLASIGSIDFKKNFNPYGNNGKYLKNFVDSIALNEYNYEDYNETDKELLSLLGIKNEDDFKEFSKLNTTKAARANALVAKLESIAIASNALSDDEIKLVSSLDEKLLSIVDSDQSIITAEKNIKQLREDNKDVVGADKILDKYSNDLNKYKDFLKNYNLEDSLWQNVSIKLGTAIKDDLGKYMESFYLDPSAQKDLANSFYNSIKDSGFSGKALDALFNVDYSELSKGTFDDALKIILEKLESADPDFKEKGNGAAKAYLEGLQGKGLVSFITTSADTLNRSILEKLEETVNFSKTYGTILDKSLSDLKNLGHIDISNLKDIKEKIASMGLDPEKYLGITNEGNYLLDYKDLTKAAKEKLGTEDKFVQKKEEERKLGIQLLDLEIQMLKAQKGGNSILYLLYEIEKAITEQDLILARLNGRAVLDVEAYMKKIKDQSPSIKDLDAEIDNQIEVLENQKRLLLSETAEKYREEYKANINYFDSLTEKYEEGLEDLKKAKDDAYQDWIDKTKAEADALKALSKAIEAVTEKQKELKAVIEGTNWKSSVDGMYNYNTALDFLTKQTERAKKNFDKVSSISEAKNNFQIYGQGLLDLKAQLTAQNLTYRTAYKNIGKVYSNDVAKLIKSFEDSGQMKFNLADYLVFDEKTGTKINMNALQKAKMPEALKKWIETQGQKANEYLSKILDNEDKIDLINEEFLEQLRKARDEYISLQDLMIDVLREKYQQEIDDLQNKYDAMNEADNKYLESLLKNLDRQRKLRDQEKNWNDLTNKERKLSLMLRDTSGGNLADVKNLLNEIEDLRTLLLDDAVDLIIEKLTEFYELLKEARDAEIQYKLTLIDDVNLLKEATEALEKILTSDDLVNWWKKNVTNIEGFSKEKLDKLTEDWNKLFSAKSLYIASIDEKMKKSITDTNDHLRDVGDEAEKIVKETSEGITDLAEKSLEEAGKEYLEALKKAKEALQDAVDAVLKLKDALDAAKKAAEASKKAFDDLAKKYEEKLAEEEKPKVTLYKIGDTIVDAAGLDRYMTSYKGAPEKLGGTTPKKIEVNEESQEYKDYQDTKKEEEDNRYRPTPTTLIRYIGKNDKGETVFYKDDKSFHLYNPYKNVGKVEIKSDISHGVLEYDKNKLIWNVIRDYSKEGKKAAEEWIIRNTPSIKGYADVEKHNSFLKKHLAFAEGGLVNYTGPAWVDGSRSKPEAFLSSEDTRRIGEAARILADLPILSQPIKEQVPTTTIGDTTIQIDVHVDSIANDYDLDEAMNKVEQRIVNAAKYAGSNVILKKH